MKTVLTEIIDYIQEMQDDNFNSDIEYIKDECIRKLEKEKQKIIDFASKCQLIEDVDFDGNVTFCFNPEEQFDKTFS